MLFGPLRLLYPVNACSEGMLPQGALVHVWADPYPMGGGFDRWAGDAEVLSNRYAAHTTFFMPPTNVTLEARFKTGEVWNSVSEVISNVQFTYYFPSGAVGLITFYHGTGGSGADWFSEVENRRLLDDAVVNGYAVVACDSSDRTNRQWDALTLLATNVDMLNMQSALQLFQERGWISSDTPVFAVGMSDGGGFASLISYTLRFQATAIYCAAGVDRVMKYTTVPTIWAMARNDADRLAGAVTNYQRLVNRGVPAFFHVNEPSPVYPLRFWRIPGLIPEESCGIQESFRSNDVLDVNAFLRESPTNTWWTNYVPSRVRNSTLEIGDQLYVCYSEHKFFSDCNDRVLQFFGAQRPSSAHVWLLSPRLRRDGGFQFTVTAEAGRSYRVQASTDLTSGEWVTLASNAFAFGTFDFIDSEAWMHPMRFYRAVTP